MMRLLLVIAISFVTPWLANAAEFRLATFSADVTPPLGHPLIGGATTPPGAKEIADPLFARGFVLIGGDKPVVLCAIDWCEIRNDSYDRWRDALAIAAGTTRARVLIHSVHQHDAPLDDLCAQRFLDRNNTGTVIIDRKYHADCVQRTAQALKDGLAKARRVTHFGTGQVKVEKIASNRRYVDSDGKLQFDRSSMRGADPVRSTAPEGVIDPWLKTLSFWDGETPICAVHTYAVHPQSNWGKGIVTTDFPGLARARRQEDDEGVFQIFVTGCCGDVTAGKYNDASELSQRGLQDRLYQAMVAAWKATKRHPLSKCEYRNAPFHLPTRHYGGKTLEEIQAQLKDENPKKRNLAAIGLSWDVRQAMEQPIDLPVIDFGPAAMVLLPGETYVELQLQTQKLRPDDFIFVMGFGECGPGFVPPETAWEEMDGNLDSWCWVGPGSGMILLDAARKALIP